MYSQFINILSKKNGYNNNRVEIRVKNCFFVRLGLILAGVGIRGLRYRPHHAGEI